MDYNNLMSLMGLSGKVRLPGQLTPEGSSGNGTANSSGGGGGGGSGSGRPGMSTLQHLADLHAQQALEAAAEAAGVTVEQYQQALAAAQSATPSAPPAAAPVASSGGGGSKPPSSIGGGGSGGGGIKPPKPSPRPPGLSSFGRPGIDLVSTLGLNRMTSPQQTANFNGRPVQLANHAQVDATGNRGQAAMIRALFGSLLDGRMR